MESGEPELALPKRETTIETKLMKCFLCVDRVKLFCFNHLPRGDWIRFDAPRRLFVDGELLADECELSVDKIS